MLLHKFETYTMLCLRFAIKCVFDQDEARFERFTSTVPRVRKNSKICFLLRLALCRTGLSAEVGSLLWHSNRHLLS